MTAPVAADSGGERRAALLADVGGTNARFALRFDDGSLSAAVVLPSESFEDLQAAAKEGLPLLGKPLPFAVSIREAAVAVAGPVTGDAVELTNVAWRFSIEEARRALGLDRLVVINDVAALAWAIPVLEARGGELFVEAGGGDLANRGATGGDRVCAVVAAGTGLGLATWVRTGERGEEIVLASEGGHRDLAASTEREWAVVRRLRLRFGEHVSVERAVSGQGIANLWTALSELDGAGSDREAGAAIEPKEVAARATAGEPRALEAMALFSGWLGAFAGDLALTVGAKGGIWLSGGMFAAVRPLVDRRAFGRGFYGKGRFEPWLREVQVRVVAEPNAAFLGLARRLGRR
jgi:glucokinase